MGDKRDIVERLRDGCPGCNRMECKAADEIATLRDEIARLREERRWVPVGERLPDGDEEWVDIAGEWGDCVGWYDTVEWHNVLDDPCPGEVTHWKKRTPGPEGEA
jgi:hypothetical protein